MEVNEDISASSIEPGPIGNVSGRGNRGIAGCVLEKNVL